MSVRRSFNLAFAASNLITRRRLVIALGAGALTAPFGSLAQQPGKIPRIGFLGITGASSLEPQVGALRSGLSDLGYIDGKNLAIDFRWAEGKYDQLPRLASELVRLKVDVIVTYGPGIGAAKGATTTVPIVLLHADKVIE
jgi:putative ABC transport system substrate-binding protein